MDLKSLRDELRALRKEKVKPVSRMRKADISAEIEKLKVARETTPAPAAVPSAPLKKSKAAVESIKEAKAAQFPVMPEGSGKVKKEKAMKSAPAEEKKKSKKDILAEMMKLMAAEEDD